MKISQLWYLICLPGLLFSGAPVFAMEMDSDFHNITPDQLAVMHEVCFKQLQTNKAQSAEKDAETKKTFTQLGLPADVWNHIADYLPGNDALIKRYLMRRYKLTVENYNKIVEAFLDTFPYLPGSHSIPYFVNKHFSITDGLDQETFQQNITQAFVRCMGIDSNVLKLLKSGNYAQFNQYDNSQIAPQLCWINSKPRLSPEMIKQVIEGMPEAARHELKILIKERIKFLEKCLKIKPNLNVKLHLATARIFKEEREQRLVWGVLLIWYYFIVLVLETDILREGSLGLYIGVFSLGHLLAVSDLVFILEPMYHLSKPRGDAEVQLRSYLQTAIARLKDVSANL